MRSAYTVQSPVVTHAWNSKTAHLSRVESSVGAEGSGGEKLRLRWLRYLSVNMQGDEQQDWIPAVLLKKFFSTKKEGHSWFKLVLASWTRSSGD